MASSIALLFPGQGSQRVGMGRELYDVDAHVRDLYAQASDVLGYDLAALCFEGPSEQLNLTEYTQPALLVTSLAAWSLFRDRSITPLAVAGHSLGEYTAIVAAGGLGFADAVWLVQQRGQYMAEAVPPGTGLVAAVLGVPDDTIQDVCAEASTCGIVAPANFNCAGQVVIAGEKAAVERAMELAKARGARRIMPLPVSVPVHTSLMRSAATRLQADIDAMPWNDLFVPLVNNAEAQCLQSHGDVRASLVRQLPSPVLWTQSVERMVAMGAETFIEVGPGKVLSGLVKRIAPTATIFNVESREAFDQVLSTLDAVSEHSA